MLEGADNHNFFVISITVKESAHSEALGEERRHKSAGRPPLVTDGGGGGEVLHGVGEIQASVGAAGSSLTWAR